MPGIDQQTGERELTEPTKTLRTFRTGAALRLPQPEWKEEVRAPTRHRPRPRALTPRAIDPQVFFGQNGVHLTSGGTLKVGDSFKVLERHAWAQNVTWS